MAQCAYCKAETEMYAGGDVPICVECSDALGAMRKPPVSVRDALVLPADPHRHLLLDENKKPVQPYVHMTAGWRERRGARRDGGHSLVGRQTHAR